MDSYISFFFSYLLFGQNNLPFGSHNILFPAEPEIIIIIIIIIMKIKVVLSCFAHIGYLKLQKKKNVKVYISEGYDIFLLSKVIHWENIYS